MAVTALPGSLSRPGTDAPASALRSDCRPAS